LVSGQEGNLEQATRGDEELIGGKGNVNSLGLGAECECENVAPTVGTTILSRHIHSDDVTSSSEKCWLHTTFQLRCFTFTQKK